MVLVILMVIPMTATACQRRFLVLVRRCREGGPDLPPPGMPPRGRNDYDRSRFESLIVQGSNLTNRAGLIDRHV
jgi:hypothetical protein